MHLRRGMLTFAMATLSALPAVAGNVTVGKTRLEVPTPIGFVELTPDFMRAYEYQRQFIAPQNEQIAMFMPETDIPVAMRNEIPEMRRSFRLQVAKSLSGLSVSSSQFSDLKRELRTQNQELYSKMIGEMPTLFDKISKSISESQGSDFRMAPGTVVPLEVHEDSDRMLASSMFMSMKVEARDGEEATSVTVAATTTFLHLKDKVLFLYCYGGESDLHWTREASREWAAEMLRRNPLDVASSIRDKLPPVISGVDWSRVLGKALLGALAAALLSGIAYLRRRNS